MTFLSEMAKYPPDTFSKSWAKVTGSRVADALSHTGLTPLDFFILLSPAAEGYLEEMAQQANRLTMQHFGRTILLYTPLYLANYCINHCIYCGFNARNPIPRRQLTLREVELEAKAVAADGLQHLLILTGESRRHSPVSYIRDCVHVLRNYFSSISIEIYPLLQQEYRELAAVGVDGLTLYQEVYDRDVYLQVHPKGPKRNYRFRLEAPERGGAAGMRSLNIGALLGLYDWRSEVFFTGLHAAYLMKQFPEAEVSVSFPRMRPEFGGFQPPCTVSDRALVQAITALRLFLPRTGITLSTRESAALRDRLVYLGVTKMSGGSSTVIGGHTDARDGTGQFEISDKRSVAEMRAAITALGYKPVLKDWHDLGIGVS